MKNYLKEIFILFIQLFLFYMFPMLAGPTDGLGMVFIIIVGTFILSLFIGSISSKKIKYLYPAFCAIIFMPSVFIYYNDSALVHSLWYLIISSVGLIMGCIINKIINKK